MARLNFAALIVIMITAGCVSDVPQMASDGKPAPKPYFLSQVEPAIIQFRMLDGVNALRQSRGADVVNLNASLTAAAATHARDMSVQDRPWHFGSDASSPIDRLVRVGYSGQLVGEVISETYETELETLAAWMTDEGARRIILDVKADELGLAWHQEADGKIWWAMVLGSSPAPQAPITE